MQPDTVTMTNGTVVKVEQTVTGSWRVAVTRPGQETFSTGHFKRYGSAKREQQYIIELEGKGQLS